MQNVGFHDSDVIEFISKESSIILVLENIIYNKSKADAKLVIEGVSSIKIDDIPSDLVTMKTAFGDVLTLEINGDELFILIEWCDFEKHLSFVHSYDIIADKISLVIE